ncbi:hypothetical protein DXG01_008740 [Tephrocybe rancida]|nr:hypothetical protein DXG01_008740 [Tephrocybe rancida]
MDDSNKTQRPEPKTALITPSASPPHARPFFPQPYRIPDQASPTKRPRLSSTPRPTQQQHASSSSTLIEPIDFQKAREDSAMRLLDVWAGLAERYSRPLDEDDIIDIVTGKVVKDRGVLRGSQTWAAGAFADPAPGDAEDELEEDDEEDEYDELDTFTNPELSGMGLEGEIRRVAPADEVDARDAQDLREFLEAEQKRREVYGSEVDETEGSTYESQAEDARYSEPVSEPSLYAAASEEKDSSCEEEEESRQTSHRPPEPVFIDSGSDDELGGWDLAEASVVYRLPKVEDSDSEVEILEHITPPRNPIPEPTNLSPEVPWPSPKISSRRKAAKQASSSKQRQLQTPPQSQASSNPSATPDDSLRRLPPSSPPRSSSPFSSQFGSSPIKPPQAVKLDKPVSERRRTLQSRTQPGDAAPPIPRLDLAKVLRDRSSKSKRLSPTHSLHTADTPESSSGSAKPKTKQSASTLFTRAPRQSTAEVEVVLLRRTPFQDTLPAKDVTPLEEDVVERATRLSAKAKGKQKAISSNERNQPIQEDFQAVSEKLQPRRSPPPKVWKGPASAPARSRTRLPSVSSPAPAPVEPRSTKPFLPDEAGTSRKFQPALTTQTASTPGKKRKRIVSSMETVEDSIPESPKPVVEEKKRSRSRKASPTQPTQLSDVDSVEPKIVKVKRRDKRKHAPQQRHRPSDSESDDSTSQEEDAGHRHRYSSRAPSHFGESYYPYPPPPVYPPRPPHPSHNPHDQQPMYTPFQDPRAQHIFTQAIQQIFALGSAPWGPPPPARGSTPFTPTHHRRHRADHTPASMYSTPMHHPHPYPYSYDPMMSGATLPPSSPEIPPSSSGGPHRKSLVKRSRSRGRNVSFKEEDSEIDAVDDPDTCTDGESPSKERQAHVGSFTSEGRASEQGVKKGRCRTRDDSVGSEAEDRLEPPHKPQIRKRGRPEKRHQTPGPALGADTLRPNYDRASSTRRSRSRA